MDIEEETWVCVSVEMGNVCRERLLYVCVSVGAELDVFVSM